MIDASTQTDEYGSDAAAVNLCEDLDEYDSDATRLDTPTNPNTYYDVMRKSDAATVTLDEYDSDATRLDTPTNPNTMSYDVMYKSDAATVIPDDLDDSDATRLDTPTSINPENDVTAIDLEQQSAQSSDGSYIETYTSDPSYTGPDYQSLPCCKHGACYTPPGWKCIQIKRKKLEFSCSGEESLTHIQDESVFQ